MATTGARDTSTFDICEPWYGDKGGPFTRTFSPAFLSGMRGKSEEYVTYYDHLQGDSPGGYKSVPVGAPPGTMPVLVRTLFLVSSCKSECRVCYVGHARQAVRGSWGVYKQLYSQ